MKRDQASADCFSSSPAVVVLNPGQSLTPMQVSEVWGSEEPVLPVDLVACIESAAFAPPSIVVAVQYRHQ